MRIGLLGNHRVAYSSENHHAQSLEALGHRVVRVQEGCPITYRNVHTQLGNIQLLVWVKTHGWQTPGLDMLLAHMRREQVPIIAYHLDLYLGIPDRWAKYQHDPYLRTLTHFFTVDGPLATWLNANTDVKGHYLPPGVFAKECTYEPAQLLHDVIFVGSKRYHKDWPFRPRLLDWLEETYGSRFELYGQDAGRVMRGLKLNQLYASTKVVVGDSFCPGFTYGPYFSDRVTETTGRGGMLIHPRVPGIGECFKEDEEIVLYDYNDFDGLKTKIDYYLTHGDEREAIRRAGHERTKRDHVYTVRWRHILDTVFGGAP